jgi:putative salt-induced outer membrane protein
MQGSARSLPSLQLRTATYPFSLLMLAVFPAMAQDLPSSRWGGDLEIGYVSTQGNSEASSLKGRADAKRETDLWRYNIHFDTLNSSEDGDRSAERYFGSTKLDYKFGPRAYTFGYLSYEDDRFSGYDWQAVAASGIGYQLLDTGVLLWEVEVGPGYRINKVEETAERERDVIMRGFTRFQWNLSDSATFEQELSVESGNENSITRSITSIKSTIIGQLAMKLSYTVKYTDEVPVGTEHADRETAVTLVYGF